MERGTSKVNTKNTINMGLILKRTTKSEPIKDKDGNTNVMSLIGEQSNSHNNINGIDSTVPGCNVGEPEMEAIPFAPSEIVKQTFSIGADYMEKLRDYVFMKRSKGDVFVSQTSVIQQGLDLIFQDQIIPPRPSMVREQEDQRNLRIKKGKSLKSKNGRHEN